MAERHVITGRMMTGRAIIEHGLVATEADLIVYSGPEAGFDSSGFSGADHVEVPEGGAVLPGLIDLHCHGAVAGDFSAADETASRSAVDFLHRSGTTSLLGSIMTASPQVLWAGIGALQGLVDEDLMAGIHLEGPFLSPTRCGAQDPKWLLEPDLQLAADLIEVAAGRLKTMTYAPELAGADDLVDLLTAHGVTPSLGHTDCDAATAAASLSRARAAMTQASDADARRPTVTHLFNGMPPLHHRAPGPVAACLRQAKAGEAVVELIADDVHLDPQTVRMVFELVGAENIALVTDSMAATGLSDGHYVLGASPVTVHDGTAKLNSTGAIAGGTQTLLDVLRLAVAAGVPPADAVASATSVPAQILGLPDRIGSLRRGLLADLVLTDSDLRLQAVMRRGRWLK